MNASASSWTPTSITVTVPAGAPQGPQQVEVTTGGVTQSVPLFVGVDFPTGTLEQLTALALPKGTAVRLGTGRFESTTPGLALDNLSLYGRGETLTTVAGPAMPDPLYLYADEGYDLVLADLTLETGFTTIVPTPLVTPDALAVASAATAETPGSDLGAVLDALGTGPLDALAASDGSFELRDVTLRPASGSPNGVLATANIGGSVPDIYSGALRVRDVTANSTVLGVIAITGGDIDIVDSRLDVGVITIMSFAGKVTVDASTLSSTMGLAGAALSVQGFRGLRLTDSTFTNPNGNLQFMSGAVESSPSIMSAETTMANNTFIAGDADTADVNDYGNLVVGLVRGAATFSGNEFRSDRTFTVNQLVPLSLELTFEGNTVSIGQSGVATADLSFFGGPQQITNVEGNTVTFLSSGGVRFSIGGAGSAALTSLSGNEFTGNGSGTALTVGQANYQQAVYFEAAGNVFTDFENALHLVAHSNPLREPFNARISNNVFDFVIDAAPKTATVENMTTALSDLNATRNLWGTNTDATVVASYVTSVSSDPGVLRVSPLTAP